MCRASLPPSARIITLSRACSRIMFRADPSEWLHQWGRYCEVVAIKASGGRASSFSLNRSKVATAETMRRLARRFAAGVSAFSVGSSAEWTFPTRTLANFHIGPTFPLGVPLACFRESGGTPHSGNEADGILGFWLSKSHLRIGWQVGDRLVSVPDRVLAFSVLFFRLLFHINPSLRRRS